jgi:hypothetical protein
MFGETDTCFTDEVMRKECKENLYTRYCRLNLDKFGFLPIYKLLLKPKNTQR